MFDEESFTDELFELDRELRGQWFKWGDQRHDDFKWTTILAEEVGEAAKEMLENRPHYAYRELMQVAAVAVNHARTIRLREASPDQPHPADQ